MTYNSWYAIKPNQTKQIHSRYYVHFWTWEKVLTPQSASKK